MVTKVLQNFENRKKMLRNQRFKAPKSDRHTGFRRYGDEKLWKRTRE